MQKDMGGLCKKIKQCLNNSSIRERAAFHGGRKGCKLGPLSFFPERLGGVEGWGMNKDSHARQRACVLQNS